MLSFSEFQEAIADTLKIVAPFLQTADLTRDPLTSGKNDLPLYQFRDTNECYSGHYSREGHWSISLSSYTGNGETLDQAITQMFQNMGKDYGFYANVAHSQRI